jgi:hypothetical protein
MAAGRVCADTTFTRSLMYPRPQLVPARQRAREQKTVPVLVPDGYPQVSGNSSPAIASSIVERWVAVCRSSMAAATHGGVLASSGRGLPTGASAMHGDAAMRTNHNSWMRRARGVWMHRERARWPDAQGGRAAAEGVVRGRAGKGGGRDARPRRGEEGATRRYAGEGWQGGARRPEVRQGGRRPEARWGAPQGGRQARRAAGGAGSAPLDAAATGLGIYGEGDGWGGIGRIGFEKMWVVVVLWADIDVMGQRLIVRCILMRVRAAHAGEISYTCHACGWYSVPVPVPRGDTCCPYPYPSGRIAAGIRTRG